MTISLPALLQPIVIAAICGAIGQAIAGNVHDGLIESIAKASEFSATSTMPGP